MAEKLESKSKITNWAEQASRFMRNVNALGAVAIAGVAAAATVLMPVAVAPLAAWSGINAAQAGFFELTRQAAANSRKKKETKT